MNMENKKENKNGESEFRQDIISKDWVIIATGRAKRPQDFSKHERSKDDNGTENCLFCDPEKTGQEEDVLIYENSQGEWTLRVFPNKYPAVSQKNPFKKSEEGPYSLMTGTGYHEVIVTRDHYRQLALLSNLEAEEVLDAYQDRYLSLMNKKEINYISIFHNHGKEAGASIAHPHSQLMAIPVISPYVRLELDGAENYYQHNHHCAYCVIAEHELKVRKRIVFENEKFIVFCPFSSRSAFEVWVMPKKHNPYFEKVSSKDKVELAEALRKALGSIYKALNDPSYNFYIHTAPCDGKDYPHYHWHIEILPHVSTWAGFELQTGIEISTIQPEAAAEYLRENWPNS